jgi:hypothetical protein
MRHSVQTRMTQRETLLPRFLGTCLLIVIRAQASAQKLGHTVWGRHGFKHHAQLRPWHVKAQQTCCYRQRGLDADAKQQRYVVLQAYECWESQKAL